ncbi:DUF982 domain-containing protein [Mesorhizobium sp. BR1-1-7]|uniref:DUF982 domain-containing protein n=1 Tax=Mesorhizobium sp. BR1-1-7 TaxID=2876647 RepID=UPI001CCF8A8C|nr:DUF982 domain-containing protein [Mesorhizobium sp. BR1-1-7]MBZ9922160.1 DUF982 domain-containing protein [Mesorhizobium sp. BR1-1-7]
MQQLDGRKMTFAPVRIRDRSGPRLLVRVVRNVRAASDVMLEWPGRGSAWRTAAEVISEALYGRETPEAARAAFLAAAEEAGVLMVDVD